MADDDKNDKTYSQEYVTRLNNEAAATRKELDEFRARFKEIDDAKALKDEEEAKKRGEYEKLHAELKAELEQERRSNAQKLNAAKKTVLQEAIRAQLADVSDPDFVKLFDTKAVKIDDDFQIEGLTEAVAAFREAKPHLFKEGGNATGGTDELARKRAGASPGGNATGGGGSTFFDASKASPAEIDAYLQKMGAA